MSSFSGLNTALNALYAQRRGMEVAGQNIANVNTEGYSRQRVNLEALGGPVVPAIFATTDGQGNGVTVSGVDRLRDMFLEARGRTEHAQNSYLAGQQQIYARVEQVFGEPSDTGLQSQLSQFWSSWHDLTNRPGDLAARTQVLQRGSVVADTLHGAHDTLSSLWSATREQVDAVTTEINTTASQVAQLNQAVVRAKQAELPVNELADQRDKLLLRLSELTGSTVAAQADGSVNVTLAGSSLVNGGTARAVATSGATRMDDQATTPVALRWADSGVLAAASSGEMASLMETVGTTLPYYATKLDTVAASLATAVNTQHAAGKDLAGAAGLAFFGGSTAADLTVAITDPTKIAAAGATAGGLDGSNADSLAGLANSMTGPDREYRQVVVNLGVAAQTANRRAGIQDMITSGIDTARDGQAGVNIDEEMTSMISYERAYQAASRVMTAIDEMLDTLINHTGLVGR